jgi:hypothetical protein
MNHYIFLTSLNPMDPKRRIKSEILKPNPIQMVVESMVMVSLYISIGRDRD